MQAVRPDGLSQENVDDRLYRLRGRSLIRRFAYLDEHVEMLVDGLRKAGLEQAVQTASRSGMAMTLIPFAEATVQTR